MRRHIKSNAEEASTIILKNEEVLSPLSFATSLGGFEGDPRAIWLTTEVYPDTVATVIQQIDNINFEDSKKEKEYLLDGQHYTRHPIKLYISSYGGSVYDGLGLVGAIQASKTPVHTYAVGKVMSMGFILAVSGHKRFAYPHTSYMFHSLSSVHWGKFSELQESVIEDGRLQAKLDGLTTSLTRITQDRLNEVHEKKLDWYFDSQDALDLKCVDEIVS